VEHRSARRRGARLRLERTSIGSPAKPGMTECSATRGQHSRPRRLATPGYIRVRLAYETENFPSWISVFGGSRNPLPVLLDRTSKALQPHLPRALAHDPLHDAGADAQRSADLEDAVAFGAELTYAGLDSRLRFSNHRIREFFRTQCVAKNSDKSARFRREPKHKNPPFVDRFEEDGICSVSIPRQSRGL
jgi:hypothetical protein